MRFVSACRVLALFVAASAISATFSRAATVAYYRFEGTPLAPASSATNAIIDSSGNNYHGTAFNGPTFSSAVASSTVKQTGAANSTSLSFNGVDQRVFVPDYAALHLSHSMTLEASVFFRGLLPGNADGNIIFRGDDYAGFDPYRLTIIPDTSSTTGYSVQYQILHEDSQTGPKTATLTTPIALNQYISIQATLDDATGAMKLYVDGTLKASTTTTVRPTEGLTGSKAPGIGIGALQSANPILGKEYLNALIDEVRFSDTALSASQFLSVPEPTSLLLLASAATLFRPRRRA